MLNLCKLWAKPHISVSFIAALTLTPRFVQRSFSAFFLFLFLALCNASTCLADSETIAGPAYSDFSLTLTAGHRREALGPLYFSQQIEDQSQWALPPLFCYTRQSDADWTEWDLLYPLVDYRKFGNEWFLQIGEMLRFDGGHTQDEHHTRQITLFPLYFEQRSDDPALRYTAIVPFYGHLKNRLFRDHITFAMFPIYVQTTKKDVTTDNYFYPFVHKRRGDHLSGWQVWPIMGREQKDPTLRTNSLDELETVGGYQRSFTAWPFYIKDRSGLGTTNVEDRLTMFMLYARMRSQLRNETYYGWPLGYARIDDARKNLTERALFWPAIVEAHGSVEETRVFPFFSHVSSTNFESRFFLWPAYSWHDQKSPGLDRRQTRVLFFLYNEMTETNGIVGGKLQRKDFWPLFAYRHERNGDERLQLGAPLEPFFPNNRTILREYSQLWSVWRWEKNAKTGATSQSLLWNLYRREKSMKEKKISLLFGVFRYQSTPEGTRWRLFWVPLNHKPPRRGAARF